MRLNSHSLVSAFMHILVFHDEGLPHVTFENVRYSSKEMEGTKDVVLTTFVLDACKDAIRGVTYSSWHMGHNPQGKKYDDIELILRDEKHIEMFLELADERDSDFDTLEAYANGAEPF